MIINENGKKILRLSLQKAVITAITGVLVSAITFISIGFKLAFNDHFTLGNVVIKVDRIEQSLSVDYVKKDMFAQEQKIEDEKFKSIDKNLDSINKNIDLILNNLINSKCN